MKLRFLYILLLFISACTFVEHEPHDIPVLILEEYHIIGDKDTLRLNEANTIFISIKNVSAYPVNEINVELDFSAYGIFINGGQAEPLDVNYKPSITIPSISNGETITGNIQVGETYLDIYNNPQLDLQINYNGHNNRYNNIPITIAYTNLNIIRVFRALNISGTSTSPTLEAGTSNTIRVSLRNSGNEISKNVKAIITSINDGDYTINNEDVIYPYGDTIFFNSNNSNNSILPNHDKFGEFNVNINNPNLSAAANKTIIINFDIIEENGKVYHEQIIFNVQ